MSFFAKNTCNLISKCYNRLNKRKQPLERKGEQNEKKISRNQNRNQGTGKGKSLL